jgi:hypothetical protein
MLDTPHAQGAIRMGNLPNNPRSKDYKVGNHDISACKYDRSLVISFRISGSMAGVELLVVPP